MANEQISGAASGAGQGAAAGAQIGGGWGALIGGVIGGIAGLFGGGNAAKAKKYSKLAAEQRRKAQTMQNALARRDLIRSMRMQRAATVAAGASESGAISSAVAGASSSVGAQGTSALTYFDSQVGLDNLFQEYSKKAGKYAEKADLVNSLLGVGGGLAASYQNISGLARGNTQDSFVPSYTTVSFNNSAAQANMRYATPTNWGNSLNLGP